MATDRGLPGRLYKAAETVRSLEKEVASERDAFQRKLDLPGRAWSGKAAKAHRTDHLEVAASLRAAERTLDELAQELTDEAERVRKLIAAEDAAAEARRKAEEEAATPPFPPSPFGS